MNKRKQNEFAVFIDDFTCSAWNLGERARSKDGIVLSSEVLLEDTKLGDGRFAWALVAPIGVRLDALAERKAFRNTKAWRLYDILKLTGDRTRSSEDTKPPVTTETRENYIASLVGACLRKAQLREAEVRAMRLRVAIPWLEPHQEKVLEKNIARVAAALGFEEGTSALEDAHQVAVENWKANKMVSDAETHACIAVWRKGISVKYFKGNTLRFENDARPMTFFEVKGWEGLRDNWDEFAIHELAKDKRRWRSSFAKPGEASGGETAKTDFRLRSSFEHRPVEGIDKISEALDDAFFNFHKVQKQGAAHSLFTMATGVIENTGANDFFLIGGLADMADLDLLKRELQGNHEKGSGLVTWLTGGLRDAPVLRRSGREIFEEYREPTARQRDPNDPPAGRGESSPTDGQVDATAAAKPLGELGSSKQGATGDDPEHPDKDASAGVLGGTNEEESQSGNDGRITPSENAEPNRTKQESSEASLVVIDVSSPSGASERLSDLKPLVEVLPPIDPLKRDIAFKMTQPSELAVVKVEMKVAEADKEFDTLVDIGLGPDGAVEIKCSTRGHFCPLTLREDNKEGAKLKLRPEGGYRLTLGKKHEDYCRTIQRLRHLVAVGLHILPEPGTEPEGES